VGRYGIAQRCRDLLEGLEPERADSRNLEESEKKRLKEAAAATLDWVQSNEAADCESLLARYREFGGVTDPVLADEAVRDGSAVTGSLYIGKDGTERFEPDAKPAAPRLLIDHHKNIAVIELDELASDEDLKNILETLGNLTAKAWKGQVNALVLNVKGVAAAPMLIGQMLRSGSFMVGLRSCVSAIIGCVSGRVVGPAWALLLGADYRVASPEAELHLPVTTAPECLQHLLGPSVATHLCMDSGTMSVSDALGLGILHEVLPSADMASKAAYEMASRIAGFARNSVRETMMVLARDAQEFVNAIQDNPQYLYIPCEPKEGKGKETVRAVMKVA